MDVTHPRPTNAVPQGPSLPNQPQQKFYVHSLLRKLSMSNMKANVETLSAFHTRFYATKTGAQAAEWIHSTVSAIASGRSDITVKFFNSTTTAPQPSVIASIRGTESSDVVILGSHEDSVHFGPLGRSPGVDDDGSGTVCSLEVFRVLVSSGFRPNRTVEFHFYAAEEVGLLGSAAVAAQYASEEKVVVGMMQLDMTFYVGTNNENVIGVVTDQVSDDLTQFTRQLVDAYCLIPWMDTVCGYGCSDHASWTANGYRSTFPFESQFKNHNPYIHTDRDTLEHASLEHGLEFAKLGLGFVVELASTEYLS